MGITLKHRRGKKLSHQSVALSGSLAISHVSIQPGKARAFRMFLFAMLTLSVTVTTIENGLSPLVLLTLPIFFAAVFRPNYSVPFLWSERTGTILFFLYFPTFIVFSMAWGLPLPVFITYFTFGLLLVRSLSPFTDRNIWQLIFLSVGLILINCILTNHLVFGLALPIYLFCLLGTLLMFHLASDASLQGPVKTAKQSAFWRSWYGSLAKCTLVVLALTTAMFILFPRPFLVIPGLRAAMAAAAGFAQLDQNMSYRDMSSMGGRKRIAFKVTLERGKLPENPYWRGRVLERMDGFTWRPAAETRPMGKIYRGGEQPTVYTVSPYKLQSKIVYVSGYPIKAAGRGNKPLYITSEGEVMVDSPFLFSDAYRVAAVSSPAPVVGKDRGVNVDQGGITPAIQNVAREWTKSAKSDKERAAVLERRLRSEYKYAVQPPSAPENARPLDHFLFQTKIGNCEYFSGALTLMLRSLHIPARVVEGFSGMEPTSDPREFLVRFSRAHAWVEADLGGGVWTRMDATPASGGLLDNSLVRMLTDLYDSLEYNWVRYVVYYDRADQADLMNNVLAIFSGGGDKASAFTANVKRFAPWGFVVFALAVSVFITAKSRGSRQGPDVVYNRVLEELTRKGLLAQVHPWHEINQTQVSEQTPALKEPMSRFMAVYLKRRFGGSEPASIQELLDARDNLIRAMGSIHKHQTTGPTALRTCAEQQQS